MIVVDVPVYVKKISKLLTTTPARVQANYLMWQAVASSLPFLTEEVDDIGFDFNRRLTGRTEKPPRWKLCVGQVTQQLSHAVGALYVAKYFDEESKGIAQEMISEIRKAFEKTLTSINWMEEETKEKAKEKIQAMEEHIGYPSELKDTKILNALYEGLDLNESEYFLNWLKLAKLSTDYEFSNLRKKVNKTDWKRRGNPAVANAFYSPPENSIQFPAGILQGVFFSSKRPSYLNYGAIGGVIGHEITHGFDDQGRKFDKEGNLINWWDLKTSRR